MSLVENKNKEIKLHINCGNNYYDGWINIDNNYDNSINKLDYNWDFNSYLPFEENSVDVIYDEKFFENLALYQTSQPSVIEVYRNILKIDGVLKIVFQDSLYRDQINNLLRSIGINNVQFYDSKNYIDIDSEIQNLISKRDKVMLHVGCGSNYFDGWINIDANFNNNIEKLDLNWDLRNPLPFEDNSVDFIYNEHFLEHLTVEEGLRTLKDFKRVLKSTGVLRIAMPDLADVVKLYNNDNWKEDNAEFFTKFGLSFIKTKAELININFRAWGHQWLYDWEELERRLKEAGFTQIKQCYLRESKNTELKNLETRSESNLIAEVTI